MKFNPKCNVKTLDIWLNNMNPPPSCEETLTFIGLDELEDGIVKIDGWVSARQIKMLNDWFDAHKQEGEEWSLENIKS